MSCYVKEAKHGKAIATWSYSYVESRKAGIIKVGNSGFQRYNGDGERLISGFCVEYKNLKFSGILWQSGETLIIRCISRNSEERMY